MKLSLKDKFLAVRVKLELLFTADIVNLFLNMLRVSMTKCGGSMKVVSANKSYQKST